MGPIQAAELAKRGMLHPENPFTTQGGQDSGNIGGHARFEALRRSGPRGPTPTAPEALAEASKTSWVPLKQGRLGDLLRLFQRLSLKSIGSS